MKIALIQDDIAWENPDANFARLDPLVARAAVDGARLVVCPETYSTGFTMRTDRAAEPNGGPSEQFLRTRAREHGGWLCGSLPVRDDEHEQPFNRLVLAAPDGTTYTYDKLHLFTYGHEDDHYVAGHRGLHVEIDGVRCTFAICYDLRFADLFWDAAPDTDCYVVVANWPAARREHWMTLLRARAIENVAYVAGVNRIGMSGDGVAHSGDSMIVDPFGNICAQAGDEVATLTADIDPAHVQRMREKWPFLRDRSR